MDDDARLLERLRPKSTLLPGPARAATARQVVAEMDGDAEADASAFDEPSLPLPGSPYEAAHARASNKPIPTIRFITGGIIRGLPYASVDSLDWEVSDKPGDSPTIVIRFSGLVPREAIVRGRNLLKLYDLLASHRIAWLRELPKGRDFKDASATVITAIEVKRIAEMPD